MTTQKLITKTKIENRETCGLPRSFKRRRANCTSRSPLWDKLLNNFKDVYERKNELSDNVLSPLRQFLMIT